MTFLTRIVRFLLSVWRSQAITSLDSWESTRDVAMQTISTNFDKGISWFDTHYRVVIGVRSLSTRKVLRCTKQHKALQVSRKSLALMCRHSFSKNTKRTLTKRQTFDVGMYVTCFLCYYVECILSITTVNLVCKVGSFRCRHEAKWTTQAKTQCTK